MKRIVIASNNNHKIKEFKEIYKEEIILTLNDIGFYEEIEENGTNFFENSLIKAKAVYKYLNDKKIEFHSIIADDSGLCVNALNGEPGIYSSRYSGAHGNDESNRAKLLNNLKNKTNRSAYFICVITELFSDNTYIQAEGKTNGIILENEIGNRSFGYDCLFHSFDLNKCFGEATIEEKNSVSHRARAILNLKEKEVSHRG